MVLIFCYLVNQAPVPGVASMSTTKDIPAVVTVSGTDFESNSMVIVVEKLPTKGVLYKNIHFMLIQSK